MNMLLLVHDVMTPALHAEIVYKHLWGAAFWSLSSSKRPKKPAVEMTLECDLGDKGWMKKVALENIYNGMSGKPPSYENSSEELIFSPRRTVSRGLILLKKVNGLKRRFDSEQNTGLDLPAWSLHEADTHFSNNRALTTEPADFSVVQLFIISLLYCVKTYKISGRSKNNPHLIYYTQLRHRP